MRIDAKIIRGILEAVESAPSREVVAMPGCAAEEAAYHLLVLIEAGYLRVGRGVPGNWPIALGLTLAGQAFLDDLRAAPRLAKMLGEYAQRVVTGVAVGVLLAQARVIGMTLGG